MNDHAGPEAAFRRIAAAGAFSACAAVALGAFGAHGLRQTIPPDLLAVYETGVRYQMYHALGLIAAGIAGLAQGASGRRLLVGAAWAFAIGTLLFSGSLYGLALTGIRLLGAVTPVGGLAFLAGWALFGLAFLRKRQG